jgi:hypothetical protein
MARATRLLHRAVGALITVSMHLALSPKLVGDYLVYRTGLSGRFRWSPPLGIMRVWRGTQLLASLLFLPVVWAVAGYSLGRSGLHPPLATARAIGWGKPDRAFMKAAAKKEWALAEALLATIEKPERE